MQRAYHTYHSNRDKIRHNAYQDANHIANPARIFLDYYANKFMLDDEHKKKIIEKAEKTGCEEFDLYVFSHGYKNNYAAHDFNIDPNIKITPEGVFDSVKSNPLSNQDFSIYKFPYNIQLKDDFIGCSIHLMVRSWATQFGITREFIIKLTHDF